MNIIKKKPSRVFIISLLLVLAAVAVHGDSGKRSLFAVNPGLFADNYLSGLNNIPTAEKSRPMNIKPRMSSGKIALEVLAGIAGNIVVRIESAILFAKIIPERSGEDSLIPTPAIAGYYAGSVCGSALGVYLVGNSGNVRGKFGNALLGSLLGEIVCLGLELLTKNSGVGFLMTFVLPPTLSVFMYNSSLRYRNLPEGNGLLNFHKDKLTFGIPDMQIWPQPAYGKNMKTEFGFKINVLSVVL